MQIICLLLKYIYNYTRRSGSGLKLKNSSDVGTRKSCMHTFTMVSTEFSFYYPPGRLNWSAISLSLRTLFLNSSLLADFKFIFVRCSSDAALSEVTMEPSSKAVKLVLVSRT